jgi:antitoxin ParD1/3/4
MTISLHPDIERYVEAKVKSGEFASADDAVHALLMQARHREELGDDDIAALREELDVGIAEADRGEFVDFSAEDVIAQRRAARKRVS